MFAVGDMVRIRDSYAREVYGRSLQELPMTGIIVEVTDAPADYIAHIVIEEHKRTVCKTVCKVYFMDLTLWKIDNWKQLIEADY